MCVSAVVFRGGERTRCECIQELADALSVDPEALPKLPEAKAWPIAPHECLCWIDGPALAEQQRLIYEPVSYDDGTDHFDAWALRAVAPAMRGDK